MNKRQRKKAYKKLVKRMQDAWIALAKQPKPDYYVFPISKWENITEEQKQGFIREAREVLK